MTHTITLIPGDGIGPEVTDAVVRILDGRRRLDRLGAHQAGVLAFERTGQTLPVELIDSIRRNKVALKGPVTTPIGDGFTSVNVGLRKALDLYANLRPVWNLPGVAGALRGRRSRHRAREHRGPLRRPRARGRAGRRREPEDHHRAGVDAHRASSRSSYARRHGRKRVTAIHKANIMKLSDGLFLECCAPRGARVPRHQLRRADRRRRVHAPGDEPGAVRRARAAESVRRHRVGSVRRPGRRPRRRRRREPRHRDRRVRSGARQRARHRREEPREPDGAAALGGADAAAHRRRGRRRSRSCRRSARVLAAGRVRTRDLGGTASTTEFADAICRAIDA